MNNRRDYADAYAETLVLPQKADAMPVSGGERDPLALYEEYARELTDETASAQPRQARGPRKR